MKQRMGADETAFKCLMVVLLVPLFFMMTVGSLWAWPIPDTGQTGISSLAKEGAS